MCVSMKATWDMPWQSTHALGFCFIIMVFSILVKYQLVNCLLVYLEQLCRGQAWAGSWIPPLRWKEDLDVRPENRREQKQSCPSFWLMVKHTFSKQFVYWAIFSCFTYSLFICLFCNGNNNGLFSVCRWWAKKTFKQIKKTVCFFQMITYE